MLMRNIVYPGSHRIDPAQKMARWNAPLEVGQVKQLALIARLPTHHGKPPPLNPSSTRNHCSPISAKPFSTVSVNRVISGVAWDLRFTPDCVAKVVLHRWSKILRATGAVFV
jgi:hypothetical protein